MYFIIELGSRRVVHYGVTRSPSDVWFPQQVREATPYDERPRFLIRDNDRKYGQCFTRVYVAYFNHARLHQGIGQRIPDPLDDAGCEDLGAMSCVVGRPVLGGLHHGYRRVA